MPQRNLELLVQLPVSKTLSSPVFSAGPVKKEVAERHVIKFVQPCKIKNNKGNSSLFFKGFHKIHLMLMDVLKGECGRDTFLCIKADRNPLDCPNIVYRTFLVKIGQSDVTAFFINVDGFNGRRNFLNQSQPAVPVFFICMVDEFLQS